jgi:hypothetical protein
VQCIANSGGIVVAAFARRLKRQVGTLKGRESPWKERAWSAGNSEAAQRTRQWSNALKATLASVVHLKADVWQQTPAEDEQTVRGNVKKATVVVTRHGYWRGEFFEGCLCRGER